MFDEKKAYEQKELRRRELWDQLVTLEPSLTSQLERLHAGMIDLNDLWLTYFSDFLHWNIGPNRQAHGDPVLFTEEAYDAALNTLYEESAKCWYAQYPEQAAESFGALRTEIESTD